MDRLICVSLSYTHYGYEMGMLKVPAYYMLFNATHSWSARQKKRNDEHDCGQGNTNFLYSADHEQN